MEGSCYCADVVVWKVIGIIINSKLNNITFALVFIFTRGQTVFVMYQPEKYIFI